MVFTETMLHGCKGGLLDKAIGLYEKVIEDHPDTPFAEQAAEGIAEIREHQRKMAEAAREASETEQAGDSP